jgi:luciferase family oxidoreductase group 1
MRHTIPLSVLDLVPIRQGADAADALSNTRQLAQHVERWGYQRFWLAEHHNMPGVASSATAVIIAHVAAATSTLLVGAGGIMLPNHAPLIIAEQFGTLAALFPGRIELGLGRAPGTDPLTMRALRRTLESNVDDFPNDVLELQRYFAAPQPGQRVLAVPGAGLSVPLWILGSSLFGAQLAAALGLPFAFASHFAPAQLLEASALYRQRFAPSQHLAKPRLMLGVHACVADTDAAARELFSSTEQAFIQLRRGTPVALPPPRAGFRESLSPGERALLEQVLSCAVVGTRETVRRGLDDLLARTGADELIVTSMIYEPTARLRSYELLAQAAALPVAG